MATDHYGLGGCLGLASFVTEWCLVLDPFLEWVGGCFSLLPWACSRAPPPSYWSWETACRSAVSFPSARVLLPHPWSGITSKAGLSLPP